MKIQKTYEIHWLTSIIFGSLFLILILSMMFLGAVLVPNINALGGFIISALSFILTFYILYKIRFRIWYFIFNRENKDLMEYSEFKKEVRLLETRK
ncbi:MAG: hypothetical protein MRY57_03675 [Candidatus Pacebacteria bacterium]|nr:hypothetical protein [Candidatus Paceibacterota bacterium]